MRRRSRLYLDMTNAIISARRALIEAGVDPSGPAPKGPVGAVGPVGRRGPSGPVGPAGGNEWLDS